MKVHKYLTRSIKSYRVPFWILATVVVFWGGGGETNAKLDVEIQNEALLFPCAFLVFL